MPSAFAWLAYSESERRRVLDVVRSLGERDTRDELGLATVRDGLADLLAPGVSTIQTRPRYFLFIPWIYQGLEARLRQRKGVTTKNWVASRARQEEVKLIEALVASGDTEGVIGRAAGKALQRMPSNVYWNGLYVWGIRLCPWHLDGYHHRLAVHGPPSQPSGEDDWSGMPNWHPGLPPAPENFPEGAVMALRLHEAEYLRERILETQPNSLLGQLVLNPDPPTDAAYPWHALDLDVELPDGIAEDLRHAREFSLAMHGAVLIYNLMLAEAQNQPREDWIERYRSWIGDWAEEVRASAGRFAAWDRSEFWATVEKARNVPLRSRQFINTWLDWLLAADDPAALADDHRVRDLIDARERELKRGQARLHNPRLLELWNGDNGSGTARLTFRWGVMRTHLRDIHAGLAEPAEAGVA